MWGVFGTVDGYEGPGNFTSLAEDCGCSHTLLCWPSPGAWSWHLPFRSLSPMAGANHAPRHSNMVKSKVIAWIHPLQTGLALFVTWGIG